MEIISNLPPIDEFGRPKLKFEVKMRTLGPDPSKDGAEKAVFINNKKLDFKIDVLRYLEAQSKGINFLIEEQKRIEKSFVKCVSDFLGRKVTVDEIKKATLEGWICE